MHKILKNKYSASTDNYFWISARGDNWLTWVCSESNNWCERQVILFVKLFTVFLGIFFAPLAKFKSLNGLLWSVRPEITVSCS